MSENDNPNRKVDLTSLGELADSELVGLLVAGIKDAMEIIFDRYYRTVMGVALHIVRDPGEAQDVVQIVFTDFYRKAKLFDPMKGSLKTWLLQYSYGRSINRKQSLKSRHFYDQPELKSVDAIACATGGKVLDLESLEAARLIEQVLATLSEHQRAVIEMVCFQGLTLAETAGITGESIGNVQHAYYRGIEKLRSYLKGTEKKEEKTEVEAKRRVSLFRGLRKVAQEIKDREVEIVKARAL